MTDDRSETIETMRKRYLHEYTYIYKKEDRIAFFKEIGEMAAAAPAPGREEPWFCSWPVKSFLRCEIGPSGRPIS